MSDVSSRAAGPIATGSGRDKLDWLQCARAIAAIAVAGYHACERLKAHTSEVGVYDIFRFGYLGVDLFFVISGFIILYIHHKDIGVPKALGRYAYRRATRIYPLYWILFALVVPLYFVFPSAGDGAARDPASILRCFFLLPNPGGSIVGVAWTLVYEVSFYAMFALLILSRRIGLAVIALWALLIVTERFGHRIDLGYLNRFFGSKYLEFGVGAAVYFAARRFKPSRGLLIAGVGLLVLMFAAFASQRMEAMIIDGPWRVAFAGLVSGVIIFGFVTARSQDLSTSWWGAILVKLGDASYSIYLFHWLVGWVIDQAYGKLGLAGHGLAQALFFPVMLTAMVLGGYIVHVVLERRLMALFGAWGRTLFPRSPPPVVAAAATR
jgi:peptidoglycan/LPS O-acetylase OafA/YrhL